MINSPYQTTAFGKHVFDKTASLVRRLEIDGKLVKVTGDGSVMSIPKQSTEVPPFGLWLTREEVPTMNASVVFDGRAFLKEDGTPAKADTYAFFKDAGILIRNWVRHGSGDLKDTGGDFLVKVFSQWMRNGLTARLGVDIGQVYLVQAVMAIYYLQLHTPLTSNSSGQDVDRILNRAARVLPATDPITLLDRLGGHIEPLATLEDAIDWIRKLSDSPRMEGLTMALARTTVARAWPYTYKEVSSAAVEYPPIFAAMVYHTLKNSGFIRTELGDLIKKSVRGNESLTFIKSMERYLNG